MCSERVSAYSLTLIPRLYQIKEHQPYEKHCFEMLDITSLMYSSRIDEFPAIRIESFIVNFSLELIKFDISTCALKRG